MLSVVLDSTILVSSFLSEGGLSFEILQQGRAGKFIWCCAEEILQETRRVLLQEQRIRKRYRYTNEQVNDFLDSVKAVAVMAQSLPEIHVIERDPKDDKILACAVATQANYIITRDKDLLDLNNYHGTIIIAPEDFIAVLRHGGNRL
jgi:putative PIN family toxin of toxin-antitoxin system